MILSYIPKTKTILGKILQGATGSPPGARTGEVYWYWPMKLLCICILWLMAYGLWQLQLTSDQGPEGKKSHNTLKP